MLGPATENILSSPSCESQQRRGKLFSNKPVCRGGGSLKNPPESEHRSSTFQNISWTSSLEKCTCAVLKQQVKWRQFSVSPDKGRVVSFAKGSVQIVEADEESGLPLPGLEEAETLTWRPCGPAQGGSTISTRPNPRSPKLRPMQWACAPPAGGRAVGILEKAVRCIKSLTNRWTLYANNFHCQYYSTYTVTCRKKNCTEMFVTVLIRSGKRLTTYTSDKRELVTEIIIYPLVGCYPVTNDVCNDFLVAW